MIPRATTMELFIPERLAGSQLILSMNALWQVPVITCIPSHSHGLIPFYVPLFLSSSLDDVMRIIIQLLKTILRTDWCTHDIRRWWWQNMRFQVVTSDSVPPPATVSHRPRTSTHYLFLCQVLQLPHYVCTWSCAHSQWYVCTRTDHFPYSWHDDTVLLHLLWII